MKYALLVYSQESWDTLPLEQRRSLHGAHRPLQEERHTLAPSSARVIAHYRARPPQHATTIRGVGDDMTRTKGPARAAGETLRALYLLESDNPAAVDEFATSLPAIRIGGTVEIWPLIEPNPHPRELRGVAV